MAEVTNCAGDVKLTEILDSVKSLSLNLVGVQTALDNIPTKIDQMIERVESGVESTVRAICQSVVQSELATFRDECRTGVSSVAKAIASADNTVAALETSLTSSVTVAVQKVNAATADFGAAVGASVTEATKSLKAAGADFERSLQEATSRDRKAFLELAEAQLKQVTTGVSSLFNALSMSYANWIAEALQAAKIKTDASFYAQELSDAVDGLAMLIDRVSEAQQVMQAVDNMAEQVSRLTEVHAQIVPHLEEFSDIARRAVTASWVENAKDAAMTAVLVKKLTEKPERRLT